MEGGEKMDLLISAATHRSGSTLVQRIFNRRKETLIWGEQYGILTQFQRMHQLLKEYSTNHRQQRENYFRDGENPNHWIACMVPELDYVDHAVEESVKTLFATLYAQHKEGHDIIGFKEVRYGKEELTLFRICYPETPILLLVRNPLDVWKSMLGAGLGNNVVPFAKKWQTNASYYLDLAKQDPAVYLVRYEDIVLKQPDATLTIAKLGKLSEEEIDSVIAKKIWSTPRTPTTADEHAIIQTCGSTMKAYGYM